ncbi:hypothetical protein ACJMK2_008971 [Sinanodonta woodiana]|uniref:Aquaporin n=1 Tax=Sinanodonta woodiana TaxID=1069815 RepID=A0ABD3VAT9_SINWO
MWKIMQENLEDLTSANLWRALAAEFLGTLFLVLVGCGSIENNGQATSVVQVALAFGLVFGTLVWCVQHISGGHLNPAITAGALVVRRVSIIRGLLYIIAQCVGAIAGAAVLYGVASKPEATRLGVNTLNGITAAQGFGVELMVTFILVFVVLASTDEKRTDLSGSAPLTIGLAVAAGHLFAFQYTKCSMNSARSFGPAVIKNSWESHWVYWVGPVVGGILAALVYEYIFSAGATFTRTKKFVLRSKKCALPTPKEKVNDKADVVEIQMEEKKEEEEKIEEKVIEEEPVQPNGGKD